MIQALARALAVESLQGDALAQHLADNLTSRRGFGALNRGGAPSRSRASLAQLWATNPWVRLAGDIVAARQAAAEWVLLLPRGRNARTSRARLAAAPAATRKDLISEAISAGEVEEVLEHPFLDMLRTGTQGAPPWIELPGYEVDKLERLTIDLLGGIVYVLFRDPSLGIPARWWPVSPLWVMPPTPQMPAFQIFGTDVPPEEIAWFRQPRPDDFYAEGAGVAQSLDHEIQINESAAAYLAALLRNHNRPDLLIMAPGLGRAEEERFEASWRQHRGPHHAGFAHFVGIPPALVAGGAGKAAVTVQDLSHTPADTELEEGQKARRDAILQVWRVPPAIVGQTESTNRATAREAESWIRQNRIIPDLESRRNWLQTRFFEPRPETGRPEYEGEWILVYRLPNLDPEDDRVELMKASPTGFLENDVRHAAGLPPVDGGDERYFGWNERATREESPT